MSKSFHKYAILASTILACGTCGSAFAQNKPAPEAAVPEDIIVSARRVDERLAEAYASLSDQIEMAYVSYYRRRPDISQLVDNHEELIEIARRGTVNDFVAALTDHIQTGLGIVRNAL